MQAIDRSWLIERLSDERGQKAALARHLGIDAAKLAKVLKGERRIQPEEIPRVLDFFGEGSGGRRVPVVSYVGAGAEIYPVDDHAKGGGIDEIPAPPGAGPSAVAVVVRGDSMWPAYKDGDTLIYDQHTPPDELIGKEAVCELEDGRVYVKTITRGAGESYTLTSHNAPPIEDVFIRWAAKVRYVFKG